MVLIQLPTLRAIDGGARPGNGAEPAVPVAGAAELARILDDLVDAIDVREAYEPEVCGWDTAATIRRLERELARAWTGVAHGDDVARAARRWQP